MLYISVTKTINNYKCTCKFTFLIKGNVIIVDTPGCADREDKEQEYVAKKMMSYLPNALAFIFVVNVANAGGIQGDRVFNIQYLFIF